MEGHHKKLGFLIILCFIIPSSLFLIKPNFYGMDSHYFLTKVCSDNNHYREEGNLFLTNLVFNNLPCDFTIIKLVLIMLYGLTLIGLYKIAEFTWTGAGYLTLLFSGISTVLLFSTFKLENDAFAIPLLYFSLYFFLKFVDPKPTFTIPKRKEYANLVLSFFLLGLAGMFWGGAIFYLLAFLLVLSTRLTIIGFLISFLIPQVQEISSKVITSLVGNYRILENNPLLFFYLNFIYLYILAFGMDKIVKKPWHAKLTVILIIFGFLNPKILILATPFISLYVVKNYLITRKEYIFLRKKITARKVFTTIAIALWIFNAITLAFFVTPTPLQVQAAQETVQLSEQTGLRINNAWEYGHLIWFYGGETKQHSGIGAELETTNTVLLTYFEEQPENCVLKKTYWQPLILGLKPIVFGVRPDLYLYQCE